jgi:glycosyltransferase involved in cell wall biosynthesis
MRIVLDLQGAQSESRYRGIGRYTLSLAKSIVANRNDHQVLIALNSLFPETIEPIRAAFDNLLSQDSIRVWLAPGPVRDIDPNNAVRRDIAERIREAFIASLEPDVVHVGSLFEGFVDDAVTSIGLLAPQLRTVVTLYDLIPLTTPQPHPAYAPYYAHKLESFRRASHWLGISRYSCDQAISLLQLDPRKVTNISGAADARFRQMHLSRADRSRITQAFGLQKLFFCSVGTPGEPRKNIAGLMRAFAGLPPELRRQFQMLVIGKTHKGEVDALNASMTRLGLHPSQIVIAGHVSDDELAALYNMCHAFVFPSLVEGFGLPVLEAMQCGAPVIASNTTSVPEVIDFDHAMFDPHSIEDMTAKLRLVLTDDTFRATLIAHQLASTRRFSWDESAKRAIKAFEDCCAGPKQHKGNAPIYQSLISSTAQVFKSTSDHSLALSAAIAIAQNFPITRAKRTLFVDVSELSQRDANTGVQRVTRSILTQLLASPQVGYQVEPVYALADGAGYRYAKRFMRDFLKLEQAIEQDTFIEVQQGDVFFGLDLQHHVVIKNKDYFDYIRNLGVKVYFLIYDLLPILFTNYFPTGTSEVHQEWLSVLSQFDGVVCISRAVADQYIDWLASSRITRLRPLRIGWSHVGADLEGSAPQADDSKADQATLSALTNGPSFLAVGTIEPRKGYAQVIAAFDMLWDKGIDLRLAIVGKSGWLVQPLIEKLRRHPKLGTHLFWLEGISDAYLEKMYAACSCLIAASEGEGFGLPLIEAARHKLPILARDIPIFREVARDHAYYFDGKSPEVLADAIGKWLELRAQDRHPTSDGIRWLTWAQCTDRLKAILLGDDWYKVWPPEGKSSRIRHWDHEGAQSSAPTRTVSE